MQEILPFNFAKVIITHFVTQMIYGKVRYSVPNKFHEKNKKNFTYTNYFIIDEIEESYIRKVKENINYNDLIKFVDIGLSTVVIKNEILIKIFR